MIKDRIWTLVSRKLSGEATASELAEIETIIKTQQYNELYLQAIEEYWSLPSEKDDEFLEATYHLHLMRLKEKGFDLEADRERDENQSLVFENPQPATRKKSNIKWYITSAIISSFAILFFILYNIENPPGTPSDNKNVESVVSTKSGSRTKIQLPDGSSVWLNGSSKLVYDNKTFGDKIRRVTLSGEAYFDVVKNTGKPFIIHTATMDIKVLGTAFNVKAYPGEKNIETSLIRGSIEVTLQGRKGTIMMKPNDKLIVSNEAGLAENNMGATKKAVAAELDSTVILMGHLTIAKDETTIVETAWVDNKLVFDNEPFEAVALKMEKWYGVSIRFEDNKLKSAPLTGSFEKETIAEAMMALQLSTPVFKYKIINQTITIFK